MTWFTDQRYAWIKESLEIFGAVRREHIMKKFGVSTAQASNDLREVRSLYPDLMQYDLSEKVYKTRETGSDGGRAKGGFARADNLSPERRAEIAKVAAKARWAPP